MLWAELTKKSTDLLLKINKAVAAANESEKTVTTAQAELESKKAELVSKSRQVGLLLLEAKKLHPAVTDFDAFIKKVKGLQLSRALRSDAPCWWSHHGRGNQERHQGACAEAPREEAAEACAEAGFRYKTGCNGISQGREAQGRAESLRQPASGDSC